tara:strand:- start:96 stop:392 length:297 start_codon:yes stop_codon:yes gene_type:complete
MVKKTKMTDKEVRKILSVGKRLNPKGEKFVDSLDTPYNKLVAQTKKRKKDMKLVKKYGADGMKSRSFGTEYKASGGNVASYYGKGGRVAGCGPAQNKR